MAIESLSRIALPSIKNDEFLHEVSLAISPTLHDRQLTLVLSLFRIGRRCGCRALAVSPTASAQLWRSSALPSLDGGSLRSGAKDGLVDGPLTD